MFLQAIDKAAELLAPAWMPQLAQRLGFDLTYALAGNLEVLADFLQRMICALADAEPLPQHLFFAWRQRLQRSADLALQVVADGRV